jgi:hypothetical protein
LIARFELHDDALLGAGRVSERDGQVGVAIGRDGVFDGDLGADLERFDEFREVGEVDRAAVDGGDEIAAPDGGRGVSVTGERAGANGGADRAVG